MTMVKMKHHWMEFLVFSRLNMIKLLDATESKGGSLNGENDHEPLNLAWDRWIRWASTQNSAILSMLWRWIRTLYMWPSPCFFFSGWCKNFSFTLVNPHISNGGNHFYIFTILHILFRAHPGATGISPCLDGTQCSVTGSSVRGIAGKAKVGFATCHLAKNIWKVIIFLESHFLWDHIIDQSKIMLIWKKMCFFFRGGWSSSFGSGLGRPPDHWIFPENDSLRKHEEKLTKHGCLSANVVLPQCQFTSINHPQVLTLITIFYGFSY